MKKACNERVTPMFERIKNSRTRQFIALAAALLLFSPFAFGQDRTDRENPLRTERQSSRPPSSDNQRLVPPEIVILKNGGKFLGYVIDEPRHLLVQLTSGGQIRFERDQVDIRANSLVEAYEILHQRMDGADYRQHLSLAGWCIQQALWGQAYHEIEIARLTGAPRLELDQMLRTLTERQNAWQRNLDRRVEQLRNESDQAVVRANHESNDSVQRASQIPSDSSLVQVSLVEQLDDEQLLEFRTEIQPRLIHGCAASSCHGPTSENQFELERLARGKPVTRPMTRRNLERVLRFIDPSTPQQSTLLLATRELHAGATVPVYPRHLSDHYAPIEQWVIDVSDKLNTNAMVDQATEPLASSPNQRVDRIPTIGEIMRPHEADRNRAETYVGETAYENGDDTGVQQAGFNTELDPFEQAILSEIPSNQFVPRDEFDPEIFNRYAHGANQNAGESEATETASENVNGDSRVIQVTPDQIEPPNRPIPTDNSGRY